MTTLLTDERDGIFVIQLNRPEARNAINPELAERIADAVEELDSRNDLHVGIVTGLGGTFCAGMDLKAFARGERPVAGGRGFAGLVGKPPEKPVIAAVEGYALAGGFEIVLACDLVVAADDAVFGLPEVTRGLVAAGGGLLRLPRRIPVGIAMELALTGRRCPASEAKTWGLINQLVQPGTTLDHALEMARLVADNAPLATRASKALIVAAQGRTVEEGFVRQEALADAVRASGDATEGARAFAEKRPPVWRGV